MVDLQDDMALAERCWSKWRGVAFLLNFMQRIMTNAMAIELKLKEVWLKEIDKIIIFWD
jgi:hypothetical protein